MSTVLEKFKTGIRDIFSPLREAEEAKHVAAVHSYDDLVDAFATAIHTGDDHGIPPADVQRIRDEAGVSVEQMEIDVSQQLTVLANADIIQKAEDYKPIAQAAIAEKRRLEAEELPAAKRRLEEIKKAIVAQENIIRRQGKLNIERSRAESQNIGLCQDHRRQQRDELKSWMLETTEQLNSLRADRDKLVGRIADTETRLEGITDGSRNHLHGDLEEYRRELIELENQISELQAKWNEAKADHRAVVDSMKLP